MPQFFLSNLPNEKRTEFYATLTLVVRICNGGKYMFNKNNVKRNMSRVLRIFLIMGLINILILTTGNISAEQRK